MTLESWRRTSAAGDIQQEPAPIKSSSSSTRHEKDKVDTSKELFADPDDVVEACGHDVCCPLPESCERNPAQKVLPHALFLARDRMSARRRVPHEQVLEASVGRGLRPAMS